MAEMIAQGLTLSDSAFKTRPDTKIFYYMDANAGLDDIQERNREKFEKSLIFPSSLNSDEHFISPASDAAQYVDEGEFRAPAPLRDYENIVEPVSGFVSAGFDVDRQTGITKLKSFGGTRDHPQCKTPISIHSIRKGYRFPYPETNRETENDPGSPGKWSDRLTSAKHISGKLGGWTSDATPKRHILSNVFPAPKRIQSAPMTDREKLANYFVYTSSTQNAMDEVNFDNTLTRKRWPPVNTLEKNSDPVSQKPFLQTHNPPSVTWKRKDGQWESEQLRTDYYNQTRPHDFVNQSKKVYQIPGYSGVIGSATDPQELDNPNNKKYSPLTICRTKTLKNSMTSATYHIPGYSGYQPIWPRPLKDFDDQPKSHLTTYMNDFKRHAPFSRMMTTVAPNNPFKIES